MNVLGNPNLFPLKTAQLISDTGLFCRDVWRSNARVWVKVKTRQLEDCPTFSCSHRTEKQPLDSLLMPYFKDLAHVRTYIRESARLGREGEFPLTRDQRGRVL